MFASRASSSSSSTPSSLSDSPPLSSHAHAHSHAHPSLAHSLSHSSHLLSSSATTSHSHSLSGSPSLLSPSVSPSAAAVVIDDLPLSVGETELLLLLKPCGRVRAINMNRHAHKSASYAIVELATLEQAEAARQQLNGQIFFGAVLKVFSYTIPKNNVSYHSQQSLYSQSHTQGQGQGGRSRYVRTAQVHISYLSKQLNLIVNEHFIRDIFSNFGEVLEVSLKKMCVDAEMCIQNGYGFVHFPLSAEGIKSAFQAVEALHQVTINQISYDCSVSNQLRQVLSQMDRDPALRQQLLASRPSHAHTQQQPPQLLSHSQSQTTSAASSWTSSSSPSPVSASMSVASSLSPSVFDPLSYSPPQNPLSAGPAGRGARSHQHSLSLSHNTHTHSFHDRFSSERERAAGVYNHAHAHRMPSLARSPYTQAHSLSPSHSSHDSLLSHGSFNGSFPSSLNGQQPPSFNGSLNGSFAGLGGSGLSANNHHSYYGNHSNSSNNNSLHSNLHSYSYSNYNNNNNNDNNNNNNNSGWLSAGIAGNDSLFGFASNTSGPLGTSYGNSPSNAAATAGLGEVNGNLDMNGLWSNPLTSRDSTPRDTPSLSLVHHNESVRETGSEREGDALLAPSPRKHSHSFSLTHGEPLSLPLSALSLNAPPQFTACVSTSPSLPLSHSQSLSARTAEEDKSAASTARTAREDDSLCLSVPASLSRTQKKDLGALSIDEQLQALWFDA